MLTAVNGGSLEESEEVEIAGSEAVPLLNADSVEVEFGRPLESVYRNAVKYYKESERSGTLHLDYDTRLRFMALAKHIKHGPYSEELADCGWFDLVGNDARREWKRISEHGGEALTPRQAMWEFVRLLDALCPTTFRHDVKRRAALDAPPLPLLPARNLARNANKPTAHIEESHIAKLANSLKSAYGQDGDSEEAKQVLLRYQQQRQQIQEALNQQTYHQFLAYAQQTHPGEPHKQEQLIRQLQDQHYEQYMSQVYAQQAQAQAASLAAGSPTQCTKAGNGGATRDSSSDSEPRAPHDYMQQGLEHPPSNGGGQLAAEMGAMKVRDEGNDEEGSDVSDEEQQDDGLPPNPLVAPANMWNSKSIAEFKATIKKEGPDGILKIGHGETVTVRVPTHEEGNSLYWEFATDHYDVGFGLYFEWTIAESNQVTVHVSETDEDEEEEEYEEGGGGAAALEAGGNRAQGSVATPAPTAAAAIGDPETGGASPSRRSRDPNKPRVDEVIPIYRRDSHLEVFAGSHTYPGQGVYLLKFDNSYSLWRSKTLYYRVFYSK